MNFLERITSLTGLSISSSTSPSEDEVIQLLKDGQHDVFDRVVDLSPEEADMFIESLLPETIYKLIKAGTDSNTV